LYRELGGNSGATIPQLVGYRFIMISTGTASTGCMEPRDWQGMRQWLEGVLCASNSNLQGFIADGTSVAEILNADYPYLLNRTLGATFICHMYSEFGCAPQESFSQNDENYCVRVEPVMGSPFAAGTPTDVFGNWCPEKIPFNVIGTVGSGFGNKRYEKINSGYQTSYAQVINDQGGSSGPNYRSCVQSCSYATLIARDLDNQGVNECRYQTVEEETAARLAAVTSEIENAIKWTLNITNPETQIGLCLSPCYTTNGVLDDDGTGDPVTRLYQNHPNPFNPRTAIRFSLAADSPVKLVIFDVNGRRVRMLVDRSLKAGTHEVIWDGSDDAGHTVASGLFWSQLQAGSYTSNKKMVVLK
jgi:hypothetical protein